jgi:hypothetical protein
MKTGEAGERTETRYYAVTGPGVVLDRLEETLRRIEWVGEQGATRIVYVFVEGTCGARIQVRVLADGEIRGILAPLPRLESEDDTQAIYPVDMAIRQPGWKAAR